MIQSFIALLAALVSISAYAADEPGGVAFVYDASGFPIGSTSGALNVSVTQPIPAGTNSIGQVIANAGTNLNTSLLALQSGANSTLDRSSAGSLGALNASVILDTHGMSVASLSLSSTWVGTISFQGSNDNGSTYPFAADAIVIPTGAVLTFVSSNAQFKIPCGAYDHIRAIMTSYTSGSASALFNSGVGGTLERVFSTNAAAFLNTSYTADGSGNAITSSLISSKRRLDSNSTLADPTTGTNANISLQGALSASIDPTVIFTDQFEGGTVDTINRWSAPVIAGGGTITQTGAAGLTISTSTTANNAAALNSQPLFATQNASILTFGLGLKIEATTIATGNYRFFGFGTQGTSYSTSDPIANGIGFEITTAGVMRAVVYASDVLIFSQNLTIPTDGVAHLYLITTRGNFTLFYLDNVSVPVAALSGFTFPDVSLLPIRLSSLNGGSTTVGTPTMIINNVATVDQSRSSTQISDGTYAWRKSKVDSNGNLAVLSGGQSSGTPTQTSVSCATSTTTLLAASSATKFISIRNPTSATATVWINTAGASAVAAAPSIDLSPGAEADFYASENSYLPTSQINCISGGASASSLTLLYK